jgi:hypothetical protein
MRISRILTLAAALGLSVCLAVVLYLPGAAGGRNDFLGEYAAGRLAGTPGLYDIAATERVQIAALGEYSAAFQYTRLPYYPLLFKPLTLLPYQWAYCGWLGLNISALVAFLWLWPEEWNRKLTVICCFLPVSVSILNGQDSIQLLCWSTLAAVLVRRGRPAAGGLVLALCASKFHLMIGIPLVLIAQRRWRVGAGVVAGGLLLLGLSFAASGPAWPLQYLKTLQNPAVHPGVNGMPNLHGLTVGMMGGAWVEAGLATAAMAAVWVTSKKLSFHEGLAVALAAGVLVNIHSYLSDCVLLLPAILCWLRRAGGGWKLVAYSVASPVPWLFLALPSPLPHITQLLIFCLVAAGSATALAGPAPASQTGD